MNSVTLTADSPRSLHALAAAVAAYAALMDGNTTAVNVIAAPPAPPAPFVPEVAGAAASSTAPAAQQGSSVQTTSDATGPVTEGDAPEGSVDPTKPVPSVDARGLRHDKRIHSDPPYITGDGVWRKKRNLKDEAFIATVEAELRGATPPPPPAAESAAPPPPPAATAAVTPPPPPPAGAVAAGGPGESFDGLMKWVGDMMGAGKLQFPVIAAECQKMGLASIAAAKDQPGMVPMIYEMLKATIPG